MTQITQKSLWPRVLLIGAVAAAICLSWYFPSPSWRASLSLGLVLLVCSAVTKLQRTGHVSWPWAEDANTQFTRGEILIGLAGVIFIGVPLLTALARGLLQRAS